MGPKVSDKRPSHDQHTEISGSYVKVFASHWKRALVKGQISQKNSTFDTSEGHTGLKLDTLVGPSPLIYILKIEPDRPKHLEAIKELLFKHFSFQMRSNKGAFLFGYFWSFWMSQSSEFLHTQSTRHSGLHIKSLVFYSRKRGQKGHRSATFDTCEGHTGLKLHMVDGL